jgi:hypothetical protein
MKSAYELAMERLRASEGDDAKPLSAKQKNQLADIDAKYKAKLAEREVFLQGKLLQAQHAGQADEAEQIRRQLASERTTLEEDREAEKEKVRRG